MKKLLSLLSVVTISGTAIPTTIAASSYQKQEKLNRNKRQVKPTPSTSNNQNLSREVLRGHFSRIKINNSGVSSVTERNNYFAWIQEVIRILARNNIILKIDNLNQDNTNRLYYVINENNRNNEFFTLPFNVNGRYFDVVIRTSDFYVQGFITNENPEKDKNNNQRRRVYRYFSDSSITSVNLPVIGNDEYYAGSSKISDVRNKNGRGEISSSYTTLISTETNPLINWYTISESFEFVTNWNNVNSVNIGILIFSIAETMRFSEIGGKLQRSNVEDSQGTPSFINFYWNDFEKLINDWDKISGELINNLQRVFISVFSMAALKKINECQNKRFPRDINLSRDVCYVDNHVFYFKDDLTDFSFNSFLGDGQGSNFITVKTGKINPIDYKKIKFIGNWSTHSSWGERRYNDANINAYINMFLGNGNVPLRKYIKNQKITNNDEANAFSNYQIQYASDNNFLATLSIKQRFGLLFYWDNEDESWNIQITWAFEEKRELSATGGEIVFKIGSGIQLLND